MIRMDRREFLTKTAALVGAGVGARAFGVQVEAASAPATCPAEKKLLRANDVVKLAKTGIKASRLALGTGTMGGREQRDAGIEGMVKVFRHGLDAGICWWETAHSYRTHPHVTAALKEVKRDKVVITTKTRAADAEGVRKEIEDSRKEFNTDYLDIVLLHCMQDARWPEKMKGPMDVLSEYRQKGVIRAVGCSCHTFEALKAAADSPWVEVDLARINPFAAHMDVKKAEDVPQVVETLALMHKRGKAVYGMKVLGQGDFKGDTIDRSLSFALHQPHLAGFTIGVSRPEQIDDLIRRIDRLAVKA